MTDGPEFTESELAEARQRIRVRQFSENINAFVTAWKASVDREMAAFAEQRRHAEKARAARRRRVDAAERHLLAGGNGQSGYTSDQSVDLADVNLPTGPAAGRPA